jgi:hypothetical protein
LWVELTPSPDSKNTTNTTTGCRFDTGHKLINFQKRVYMVSSSKPIKTKQHGYKKKERHSI